MPIGRDVGLDWLIGSELPAVIGRDVGWWQHSSYLYSRRDGRGTVSYSVDI